MAGQPVHDSGILVTCRIMAVKQPWRQLCSSLRLAARQRRRLCRRTWRRSTGYAGAHARGVMGEAHGDVRRNGQREDAYPRWWAYCVIPLRLEGHEARLVLHLHAFQGGLHGETIALQQLQWKHVHPQIPCFEHQ